MQKKQNWLTILISTRNYHKIYYKMNKERILNQSRVNYDKRCKAKEEYNNMIEAQDKADNLINVN